MKKTLIIFVFTFGLYNCENSQRKLLKQSFVENTQHKLSEYPSVEISKKNNNTFSEIIFKGLVNVNLIIHSRSDEVFQDLDTLNRDFFMLNNNKLIIDSLYGLKQSEYTGSYEILKTYYIGENSDYFILSFVDLFTFGSNQQVFFLVFKKINNNWYHFSSYENEHGMPTDDIRVVKKRNEIRLKGKYLKKIKI